MKKLKVLTTGIVLFWAASSALAQDVITLTWKAEAGGDKWVDIKATAGEEFTVNWGDGSIAETKVGAGMNQEAPWLRYTYTAAGEYTVTITASNSNCRFIYFDCIKGNQATNLNISGCSALWYLDCHNNQLTNLNVSGCSALQELYCYDNQLTNLNVSGYTNLVTLYCSSNQLSSLDVTDCINLNLLRCGYNKLQLSDLYAAHLKINTQDDKYFGTQNLPSQVTIVGEELFAAQSVFDGIYTSYSVTKNGYNALESDYTVVDGKLIFNTIGNYTVTMTNAAIVSSSYYPAKVIVEINVIEVPEISVEPSGSGALFVWQAVEGTTGYELVIYADAEHTQVICIVEFDADGNYIGTRQAAPSRFGTLATGFSYEVPNLTENTDYYYVMTALINETPIILKENSFTTISNSTGIVGAKYFSPEAQIVGYYSISGAKLPKEPASGIYMIMYSTGKVEKVMK